MERIVNKEPFSDNKFYNYSSDKYDNGKDLYEYEYFCPYSMPSLDSYDFKYYEKHFSLAENNPSFVWYPSQRQKLSESEFNQIKLAIKNLENNKDPSQKSEIYKKIDFLENEILFNKYQFFTYQNYRKACEVLVEVGGPRYEPIIYNPPLDENKFLSEKERILNNMVMKDCLHPGYGIENNTIFPDSYI